MTTLFALYLIANIQVCTVSLNFDTTVHFEYPEDAIVLNVPEYNNDTIKTAGYGGCFTGKKLIGYTDQMPSSGFIINEESEFYEITQ